MNKRISAFTDDVLGKLDATGIAEAIATRKISAEEATNAAIARAEKVNPDLNAIVLDTYTQAKRNSTVASNGIFSGVPTFVKDNDFLAGTPTQLGTGSFKSGVSKKNSSFVKQFLSTGVNILGKTTLPEFGLICSTENPRWGITRNPWNTDHTTGGSSSGSGAMVASGVVPIATANDGAGSTRIPASCCGLVGLKPSRGRIHTMDGTALMPINIVYQGVLTRSVRDQAAFYAGAEAFKLNKSLPLLGHVTGAGKKRLKIAMFDRIPEGKMGRTDDDTQATYERTAQILQGLGHEIIQMPLPVTVEEVADEFLTYYGFLAYMLTEWGSITLGRKVDKSVLEPFTLGLAEKFSTRKRRLPSSLKRLKQLGHMVESVFDNVDVVLIPVLAHSVPKIGHFDVTLPFKEISDRAINFASFTGLQNVTGAPAISIPSGTCSNGLPIGMQFIAPFGHDKRLLELAYELEQANPWDNLA